VRLQKYLAELPDGKKSQVAEGEGAAASARSKNEPRDMQSGAYK
jgi:hypothetical protein